MVLLSFDVEEFDVPREKGVPFTLEQGIAVSAEGTRRILDILAAHAVRATFFCTANFASAQPQLIRRMVSEGHEVASHGCDHFCPRTTDPAVSKKIIEAISGRECAGYREPRMSPVDNTLLETCGYKYNSSLNPTLIPGRYCHLGAPRTPHQKGAVLQLPTSVTPLLRIPLFWLALHHFPEQVYRALVHRVLRSAGCFITYFHPWEFYDLNAHPELKIPFVIRRNSGEPLCRRLGRLIHLLKGDGEEFLTFSDFVKRREA